MAQLERSRNPYSPAAQLERGRKSSDSPKTPKGQHSPTFQQLIQGDVWQFSGTSTPSRQQHSATSTPSRNPYSATYSATATPSRNPYSATSTPSRNPYSAVITPSRSPADHEEDFSPPNSGRKSVLSKVREKAKKLRQSLSMKKRHGSGSGSLDHSPTTPSWGVSLEDDSDDDVDEDPEFLGAPMYESEQAPEALKESARQHPRAVPVVPQNHALPTPAAVDHKTADSDATQDIASKISGLTVSVPEQKQKQTQTDHYPNAEYSDHQSMNNNDLDRANPEIGESISPQKWDKGVSVKEYFLNKLEPGEDDKALSQVISEVISPRKGISPKKPSGEMGVVEKVREAVTSFLRHEESSSSSRLSPNYRSMSTSPQPSRETGESTDKNSPSSKTPFSANNSNKVPSPNSISTTPAIANTASPLMSKKSTSPSSSSSAHKSSNTDVSPKSISKKDKPYVPISLSSSSAEEPPSRQTTQAKGMSVRKNISPNSISATRAQPSRGEHPSKAAIKATKAAADTSNNYCKTAPAPDTSNNYCKTAPAQHENIAFSANRSATSSGSMSRSKSLSAHMPVPNGANSSPNIPVSSNAREVIEEEAHGRILQMN